MPFQLPSQFVPAAARTTSGQSDPVTVDPRAARIALAVDVTAVSGTSPTMDLAVEWSFDGNTWFPADSADSFTQITAAAKAVKSFAPKASQARLVWTIAGTTPSFTFSATQLTN